MSAVRSCYRPPKESITCSAPWCFFLAFFLFSLRSCNLLHPRLTTFCASLRSFKMCSLRNQFDPVIAHHNEKFHVLRSVGFFIAISLFSLQSYNLLHPRLTTFCASLCSFKMCSLRNQFDPVIAHQKKASRDPLRRIFYCHFPFPSFVIPPALKKSIASHPLKGYNT